MTLSSATVGRRAAARSIDLVLIAVPAALLAVAILLDEKWQQLQALLHDRTPQSFALDLQGAFTEPSFILIALIPLMAMAAVEAATRGRTPGRQLLRLRVLTAVGTPLRRSRHALRTALLCGSCALPGWVLWPLGSALLSCAQPQRRGVHDLLTGARVFRTPSRDQRRQARTAQAAEGSGGVGGDPAASVAAPQAGPLRSDG